MGRSPRGLNGSVWVFVVCFQKRALVVIHWFGLRVELRSVRSELNYVAGLRERLGLGLGMGLGMGMEINLGLGMEISCAGCGY